MMPDTRAYLKECTQAFELGRSDCFTAVMSSFHEAGLPAKTWWQNNHQTVNSKCTQSVLGALDVNGPANGLMRDSAGAIGYDLETLSFCVLAKTGWLHRSKTGIVKRPQSRGTLLIVRWTICQRSE